jgi:hypothetical protein
VRQAMPSWARGAESSGWRGSADRLVHVRGVGGAESSVRTRYWWEPETGILSARVGVAAGGGEAVGVHVLGDDGSWLTLDVVGGRLRAIEVAIWPRVRAMRCFSPPPADREASISVIGGRAAVEVCGAVSAYASPGGAYHFRVGARPAALVWRAGRDVLLEASACGSLAGVWLLNVPPSPDSRDHDDRPHQGRPQADPAGGDEAGGDRRGD